MKEKSILLTGDFFALEGWRLSRVLVLLGPPTSAGMKHLEVGVTQYRWDDIDADYVVFADVLNGKVLRVNLVEKKKWPGWKGHHL
jgi:hypothetical protein